MANTALKAFEIAEGRASRSYFLAVGLTDQRQRSIRAEWVESFRGLMRWPSSHSIDRVDSKDVLIVLRDGTRDREEQAGVSMSLRSIAHPVRQGPPS